MVGLQVCYITTGGVVPPGADAVVRHYTLSRNRTSNPTITTL